MVSNSRCCILCAAETPQTAPARAHYHHGGAGVGGSGRRRRARGQRGRAPRAGHGGATRRAPLPGHHAHLFTYKHIAWNFLITCTDSKYFEESHHIYMIHGCTWADI